MLGWWRRQRAQQLMKQAMRSARREDYQRAIHEVSAAILLTPKAATAYQHRGMWHHLAGNDIEALIDYNTALHLAPDSAELYLERGNIRAARGDHAEAIADFSMAIQHNLHNASAYRLRARSHIARDELASAIADLSAAIEAEPNTPANYRIRAELYTITKNLPAALADYNVAIPAIQDSIRRSETIVEQLAATNADNREWAQGMLAQLKQERVEMLVQRSVIHQMQGNLPAALQDAETAISYDPQSAAAYNARGRIRHQMDDSQAAADFQKAIDLEPLRYASYLNLAEVYFKLNQYPRALAAFQQLDHKQPNNVMAQMGLALAEHAMGKRREARERWQKLVVRDAQFADLNWLKRDVFPNHPHLLREAGELVIRLKQ